MGRFNTARPPVNASIIDAHRHSSDLRIKKELELYIESAMPPKSVLITGCSEGGIGHTLALEWKSRDYRVFATARTLGAMTTLEQVGIECFEMDVTDVDGMKSVKDKVGERTGGKLDILVCNAGQGMLISTFVSLI